MTGSLQYLVVNFISFCFAVCMLCICLKPNHYFKYGFLLYLASFVLIFCIQLVILPEPDLILGCLWVIPHYLFSLSCFQCSVKESIAAPLTYSFCYGVLFIISQLLLNQVDTLFPAVLTGNGRFWISLFAVLLSGCAALSIMCHFTFWRRVPWWLLIPFFLVFLLSSFGYALVDAGFRNNDSMMFLLLLFLNALFFSAVWTFFQKKRRLHRQISYIEEQQRMQLEYYEVLCSERDALIAFQKRSLQQVHSLQQVCTASAPAYVSSLLQSFCRTMKKDYLLVSSHDQAIDALLQYKFHIAQEKNCRLFSSLVLDDISGVDKMDLVCILGNLLDNAISSCDAGDSVQVSGAAQKGLLALEVCNPYHGQVLPKQFRLPHLRENGHGSGLASVQHTAEKYGGQLSLRSHNGMVTASVTLVLDEPFIG